MEESSMRYDILFISFVLICMIVLGTLASKAGLPVIQPNEPENNSPLGIPIANEVEV